MAATKATWVVFIGDTPLDKTEYKAEAAAIKAAKDHLLDHGSPEDEVWIYRLSHVVTHVEFPPAIIEVQKVP